MTNEKFYTHEQIGEIEANTLVHNKSALGENVDELVEQGKATKVDLSGYDSIVNRSDKRHDDYINARNKIINSENPYFHDKAVQDYELGKLKAEYDADMSELRDEYEEYKENAKAKARKEKAQATVKVTEEDKATARSLVDRYNISLLTKGEARQSEVVTEMIDDISLLEDGQREALIRELPSFLSSIDSTAERSKIAQAARGNKRADAALKLAEQLPHSATPKADRYRIITRSQGERKY